MHELHEFVRERVPVQVLNEWTARVAPDTPTAILVLLHIAERICHLHALGLAHRDVKPANILWRPLANAWTLVDFGGAAPIGAPFVLSLMHTAPRVVRL